MQNTAQIILTDKICGSIKPLHGVNCAPYSIGSGSNQAYINEIFTYCGTPYSRLHDCCGSYGGTYFIDVPNIFRCFEADESCPENYDFHYSDEYIAAIVNSNTKIVYRLGVTIEWGSKKYASNPPEDFAKWARICEHIIRHYNCGWNNGFHYNIEYWEIWNEPENPPMWSGTREQFYSLYEISSKHLKSVFPNIKIGGYGSCGFYAVFRDGMSDFFKSFIPYFEDFLDMCRRKSCPLDFFTWHIYTSDLAEIEKSQNFARQALDKFGFTKTESHLNEWNYGGEGNGFGEMETMTGAAFCAGALITMQKCGVDLSQYYCLSLGGRYNGFINLRTYEFTATPHVFAAFNKLYCAASEISVDTNNDLIRIVSATDGAAVLLLMCNCNDSTVEANFKLDTFCGKEIRIYRLDGKCGFKPFISQRIVGDISFDCDADSVFYAIICDENGSGFQKYHV